MSIERVAFQDKQEMPVEQVSSAAEKQHLHDAGRGVAPVRNLCIGKARGEAISGSEYWAGHTNQDEEINVKCLLFSSSKGGWEVILGGINA